jgi:hypothetical protein
MKNVIIIVSICVAVIAASIAYIKGNMSREAEARLLAEAAQSEEAKATAEKRTAEANKLAKLSEQRTAEANQKAQEAEREAQRAKENSAIIEKAAAEENRKAKVAEMKTAEENREAAYAKRAEAEAKAKAADDEKKKAEALKLQAELTAQAKADALAVENLQSEAKIAEAKRLELMRIDFARIEQQLVEWQQDLEEREAALKPEKTIADLAWAGGNDDKIFGTNGTVIVKKKEPYLAENDKALPAGTRKLAKTIRLMEEREKASADLVRERTIAVLEKLYIAALKEDRVVDADFYKKSLKSLYPDWEFKGEKKVNEENK